MPLGVPFVSVVYNGYRRATRGTAGGGGSGSTHMVTPDEFAGRSARHFSPGRGDVTIDETDPVDVVDNTIAPGPETEHSDPLPWEQKTIPAPRYGTQYEPGWWESSAMMYEDAIDDYDIWSWQDWPSRSFVYLGMSPFYRLTSGRWYNRPRRKPDGAPIGGNAPHVPHKNKHGVRQRPKKRRRKKTWTRWVSRSSASYR